MPDYASAKTGRASHQGIFSRLALTVLLAILLAGKPAFGANKKVEASKQQLDQLHERIESLKKDLDSSQEAHAEAADGLKQSEKAISEANRKLFVLNQQHQQNSDTLEHLQKEQFSLQTTLGKQQQLLAGQLYQQYVHGKASYLQLLLEQQDPSSVSRQLYYFSYIARARANLIASMQLNLDKVSQLNDETSSTLKKIADLKSQQEQQRQELQAQKSARGKVLSKLAAQINSQRNEIDKLKRDEKGLTDLIDRLSRLAVAPKIKRKQQKGSAEPSTDSTPIARNETLPSDAFGSGSFASLKGKLNLPVRGDVSNRFGATREDSGISWKGLFIKSPEGNEVKSVASGRVVFADWMRGFGNLLIIDHGGGYLSLYGNNEALLRKVGDTVKGGDTVASVGNSGGNETFGLYYELRYLSKPFDPLSWSVLR